MEPSVLGGVAIIGNKCCYPPILLGMDLAKISKGLRGCFQHPNLRDLIRKGSQGGGLLLLHLFRQIYIWGQVW